MRVTADANIVTRKDRLPGAPAASRPSRAFATVFTEAMPRVIPWWLSIGLISAVALALRIVAIDRHSFWYDEAVAADLARASFSHLMLGIAKDNGNPPLYWMLLHGWMRCFGDSEVALRSLSAILGCISVPMMAILGRRLANPTAGIIAAVLLAISPLNVELSNEARTYALEHFLVIGSTLLLLRWLDRRQLWILVCYALSIAALCLSHYFGFFIPIAHGIAIASGPKTRRAMVPWLGAMALAAMVWMPWLGPFLNQLHEPGNLSRMGGRWLIQFAATPEAFAFGRTLVWRNDDNLTLALASVVAVVLFGCPAYWAVFNRRSRPMPDVLLGACVLLPILLPLLVAMLGSPLYHIRAGSVALPAVLLLVSIGLSRFSVSLRYVFLSLILAISGIALARYATIPLKDDWRSATAMILADGNGVDPIAIDSCIEAASFRYYARRYQIMPRLIFGIAQTPDDAKDKFTALRYLNGTRTDVNPVDVTSDLSKLNGLWLATCLPGRPIDHYKSLLSRHGLLLDRQAHFQRVDVYHFARSSPSTRP